MTEVGSDERTGAGRVTRATRARWAPHAEGLLAFERGDREAAITVVDDLGDTDTLPAAWFYRAEEELPPLERAALLLCRGRVLDVGAGAGAHSLALQRRRLEVCAVEVLPELVDLLRRRGVLDARVAGALDLPDGRWDTILMLMNGLGLPETLAGLERFLSLAGRHLSPGGQILADSTDVRHLAASDAGPDGYPVRSDGRYVGEIQFRLTYGELEGEPFSQLYVDPDTLAAVCERHGWSAEVVAEADHGAYLARIVRSTGGGS
jgi:SAM-dependent methyltransferase